MLFVVNYKCSRHSLHNFVFSVFIFDKICKQNIGILFVNFSFGIEGIGMVFFKILFVVSWICFFFFANKNKFHIFISTCYFGMILGFVTDFIIDIYPLWEYPVPTKKERFWTKILDEFGIYLVVIYFYLQYFPKTKSFGNKMYYIFKWTIFTILLEWVALKTGYMKHGLWWSLGFSYISDWILFWCFYHHNKWIERYKREE